MNFCTPASFTESFSDHGTMVGLGLFLVSFLGKNSDLRRSSYIVFRGCCSYIHSGVLEWLLARS